MQASGVEGLQQSHRAANRGTGESPAEQAFGHRKQIERHHFHPAHVGLQQPDLKVAKDDAFPGFGRFATEPVAGLHGPN